MEQTRRYEVGDAVEIVNDMPVDFFKEVTNARPPIKVGEKHVVYDIYIDKKGFQHLDLHLLSLYNFIRSRETGEEMPNGDKVHWVHPSRVKLITS